MLGADDRWSTGEVRRIDKLAASLRTFGTYPQIWAVRAPGRVNLLGEHTDYSDLPVLPIAIDRSILLVAGARDDSRVELHSTNSLYGDRVFDSAARQSYPQGDWSNYVRAAVQGVTDRFAGASCSSRFRGATMVVSGDIPPAAGLSSSAALLVAATLAFMAVNELQLPPLEIAQMAARSEWLLGVKTGGMDQAASLAGQRGHALLIRFNPLSAMAVPIPTGAVFIVADSMEPAEKSGGVRNEYNRRVIECAIAARILGRALGIERVSVMADVTRAFPSWTSSELLSVLSHEAPKRLSGMREASRLLGTTPDRLRLELFGPDADHIGFDENAMLNIQRRTRHLLTETERVTSGVDYLTAGNLEGFGGLIDASHQSLKDDFEVSTPRLNRMVSCAREAGALGARLTGAGFGGSMLALCPTGGADAVLRALERNFFSDRGPAGMCSIVEAGPGASTAVVA